VGAADELARAMRRSTACAVPLFSTLPRSLSKFPNRMGEPHIAFFDDSGRLDPDFAEDPYVLGIAVMPISVMADVGDAWWQTIRRVWRLRGHPPQMGIEVKRTDLREHARRLAAGRPVKVKCSSWGAVTIAQLQELEEALWSLLASESRVTFIAVVFDKVAYWEKWHLFAFDRFRGATELGLTQAERAELRTHLSDSVASKAFEWGVLDRVNLLMEHREKAPCILIGDQGSQPDKWHARHDWKQRGGATYTDAKHLVSNVAFGSSMFNPGLQIADWVACAVRLWATDEDRAPLDRLAPRFRRGPNSALKGFGLVVRPSVVTFPPLPRVRG
jgi:hypothetical protein